MPLIQEEDPEVKENKIQKINKPLKPQITKLLIKMVNQRMINLQKKKEVKAEGLKNKKISHKFL